MWWHCYPVLWRQEKQPNRERQIKNKGNDGGLCCLRAANKVIMGKFISATIKNWPDIVGQFGHENNPNGLKGGKHLSSELSKAVRAGGALSHVTINCNEKSEAIAIFELVETKETDFATTHIYHYSGTAN